jgi:hypothetical protein
MAINFVAKKQIRNTQNFSIFSYIWLHYKYTLNNSKYFHCPSKQFICSAVDLCLKEGKSSRVPTSYLVMNSDVSYKKNVKKVRTLFRKWSGCGGGGGGWEETCQRT